MELNYLAIILATIVQFILGAVWYGPLFGKLWGRIHGFDKLSKDVQDKMVKAMAPFYGIQFLVTVMTTVVLAILIENLPDWNVLVLALFLWLGFVLPAQVSAVIFGGTEGKWIAPKIALQAGGSLLFMFAAVLVLSFF